MGQKQTLFIEIIMGVILGTVLVAVGQELVENFSLANYSVVLLVIGLLIFAELYLWLELYHETLEVYYAPLYMYFDITLGLMFVIFVLLIRSSTDEQYLVDEAMLLCAIIFIVLSFRSYIPYRGIQDLDTKLAQARMNKFKIRIPIFSNTVGAIISICIYMAATRQGTFLSLSLSAWAWLGLLLFLFYAILMHVFELDFDISLRRR
jgi:hypothetical protein